jgi:hypothetical protein
MMMDFIDLCRCAPNRFAILFHFKSLLPFIKPLGEHGPRGFELLKLSLRSKPLESLLFPRRHAAPVTGGSARWSASPL